MSLILNIDTALTTASICLAQDEEIVQLAINDKQKDHAAWLHSTIADLLLQNNFSIHQLDAVGVSIGPGSYTGLRVGLAAAKGLCFAQNIPLLAVSTLQMIAYAVKEEAAHLICPMIDARRMEVFTALYDKSMKEKTAAHALIVDENSFSSLLDADKILFCGSGSKKLQSLITNSNADFSNTSSNASHLAQLAFTHFRKKEFVDLAYSEPLYIKEFYSPDRKS